MSQKKGYQFEQYTVDLFTRLGYKGAHRIGTITKYKYRHQIDVTCWGLVSQKYIECKYKNPKKKNDEFVNKVGADAVRVLKRKLRDFRVWQRNAFIVTNTGYTSVAIEEQENINLWDYYKLEEEYRRSLGFLEKRRAQQSLEQRIASTKVIPVRNNPKWVTTY